MAPSGRRHEVLLECLGGLEELGFIDALLDLERRRPRFQYTDREERKSVRRVEPHGLLAEPPVWYVLARDVDKAEPRMFRMDRIARPRLLPDVVFRPDVRVIQEQLPDLDRWRPLTGRWACFHDALRDGDKRSSSALDRGTSSPRSR